MRYDIKEAFAHLIQTNNSMEMIALDYIVEGNFPDAETAVKEAEEVARYLFPEFVYSLFDEYRPPDEAAQSQNSTINSMLEDPKELEYFIQLITHGLEEMTKAKNFVKEKKQFRWVISGKMIRFNYDWYSIITYLLSDLEIFEFLYDSHDLRLEIYQDAWTKIKKLLDLGKHIQFIGTVGILVISRLTSNYRNRIVVKQAVGHSYIQGELMDGPFWQHRQQFEEDVKRRDIKFIPEKDGLK